MRPLRPYLPLLLLLALPPATARAQAEERFTARVYESPGGESLPYRLFIPKGYDPKQRYPLILWLHDGGATGDDNVSQLLRSNSYGAQLWTEPSVQAKHPAFVLAPQCPKGKQWAWHQAGRPTRQLQLVIELIAALVDEFSFDLRRVYVLGQSLGGFGTWAAISAWPGLFAAAVPLCGGGDEEAARWLARIPLWAFHGDQDDQVSVERSRRMVEAIRKAGGSPRYTEYKGEGHVIWPKAFREPELVEWLFAQHKKTKKKSG